MTLYYTLVFLILISEMIAFGGLVLTPNAVRKPLLKAFHKYSAAFDKAIVALKFTFVFILVLFVDAVNRVYRAQADFELSRSSHNPAAALHYNEADGLARRFYAQRNMYLTGFTLFLSLILNRTYALVNDLAAADEKIKLLSTRPTESDTEVVAELKKQLKDKDTDIATLKKQFESYQKEYNRVSDELNAKEGVTPSDKKND